MKATKVFLYNKHWKKNVWIVHLSKSIQQNEQLFFFFFLMGLNCTQPCSLSLFMSNANIVITINDKCGDRSSQRSPFAEVTIPSALKAN